MSANYQGQRLGRASGRRGSAERQQSEAARGGVGRHQGPLETTEAGPPARPFWSPTRPISEKQRQLWQSLNAFVSERGAAITTRADQWPVRLETPKESPLPAKLRELGWD